MATERGRRATNASHQRAVEEEGAARPAGAAMTVAEAGRKGGTTTAKKHGRSFYEQIGRMGGKARSARITQQRAEEEAEAPSRQTKANAGSAGTRQRPAARRKGNGQSG